MFTRAKVAVFVDGCFWHGCPEHGTMAKSHRQFWEKKIAENKRRDGETNEILKSHGWCVVRIWEHEDMKEAAEGIAKQVRSKQASG